VELLDDALQRAAKAADEAPEQNFVRKHYLEPWGDVQFQGWLGHGRKREIHGNDPEVIHFLWHQSEAKIMILKVGSRGYKKICQCDACDMNKIFKDMNREGTQAQSSISWKIQVFHSILRSKLLYGLETIQLNQSELHRLDAFQIKGYRRILQIPPTSVDRTMTNASVKELIKSHYGVTVMEFSKLTMVEKKNSALRTHHSIRHTRSHASGPFSTYLTHT